MQLTTLLVPTFAQMLKSFSGWLDKAAAHEREAGREIDPLMAQRLAADMYPLAAQVRFACFQAQEPLFRLRDMPVPESLLGVREEGWKSNEQQGSFAQAQGHLANAMSMLANLEPDALDAGAQRAITMEMPNGIIFDMSGEQYVRDWVLPQFYFHVATGYAILRHCGVPLGKPDYVPHMMSYIRPGTLPQR